ncbi:MAG: hypothetical protein ACO35F_01855, partial [Ilumatobacteraceae bacterium]
MRPAGQAWNAGVVAYQLIDPEVSPEQWVREHLEGLCSQFGDWKPSSRFPGGQTAANEALVSFSAAQYASRRNNLLPV